MKVFALNGRKTSWITLAFNVGDGSIYSASLLPRRQKIDVTRNKIIVLVNSAAHSARSRGPARVAAVPVHPLPPPRLTGACPSASQLQPHRPLLRSLVCALPAPTPFHDLKARKYSGKAGPATQHASFTQDPSPIISGGSQHETMLKTKLIYAV